MHKIPQQLYAISVPDALTHSSIDIAWLLNPSNEKAAKFAAWRASSSRFPRLHRHVIALIVNIMIVFPNVLPGHTAPTSRPKKKHAADASGFSGYMDEAGETESISKPAASAPIAATNPLLGLQEISDSEVAVKRAVRHGHATLDQLEDIRLALLCGGIPLDTMHQIDNLVAQERELINDPTLNDILDEIELRVAVERAKLEMALHQPS